MVGNFPALFNPGPRRRGICLMIVSEARKASCFFAGSNYSVTIHLSSNEMYYFVVNKLTFEPAMNNQCHQEKIRVYDFEISYSILHQI